KVTLGIVRDGKDEKLVAELTDRTVGASTTKTSEEAPDAPEAPEKMVDKSLGVVLHEITGDIRREYRTPTDIDRLLVVHVATTSQAWEKGLREGDVIVEVNRKPVTDMDSFRQVTSGFKPGSLVNLYVVGQGASRFVTIRVED